MKEYLIGLAHPESIQIPAIHNCVSRHHAKIVIDDNGNWMLVDTNSLNGTFVMEANGNLRKINQMVITPTTKIQLGPPNINGFSFIAGLVLGDESFTQAWDELSRDLKQIQADEKRTIRRAKIWNWCQRLGGVLGIALSAAVAAVIFKEEGTTKAELNLNRGLMVACPLIIGLLADFFMADREQFIRRRKQLRCPNPKCDRILSENEIERGQCAVCKCHR